jgi:hypothetical protein
MEELLELHQRGTTEDYIEHFERLRSKLLMENRLFSELDFLDAFVGGLKPDIRAFVKTFKPHTLEDAFDYALNMDDALDSQLKRLKFSSTKPTAVITNKPFIPQPSKKVIGTVFQVWGKIFSRASV